MNSQADSVATMVPFVLRRDHDGIATLTLNRPDSRNPLSRAMMSALSAEFEQIAGDPAVKAVVLRADGPAFCAGHDLREIRADSRREAHEALMDQCSSLMLSISALPKPVIAAVQGIASAAGCQIVASCDLAIAGQSARFVTPGVNIGLFCSTPMVALSRAVGRKAAMRMLLTGEPISADHALAIGLVNEVVPDDKLAVVVEALAIQIAGKSQLTLAIGKEAFYQQIEMNLDDAYRFASDVMVGNLQTEDAAEGIDAFLERREPRWTGR